MDKKKNGAETVSRISKYFNPWHHVEYGKKAPSIVNAIIEIPQGSKAKYELDKKSGLLKLDRVLFSAVYYPANYGFLPRTLSDDGDPLDILVLSTIDVDPMCIIESKVIGMMRMVDEDEIDDKIIAVANNDIAFNHITDMKHLPPHTTIQLKRFFEDYKKLEHKHVVVEKFYGKSDAYKIIRQSIKKYKKEFEL